MRITSGTTQAKQTALILNVCRDLKLFSSRYKPGPWHGRSSATDSLANTFVRLVCANPPKSRSFFSTGIYSGTALPSSFSAESPNAAQTWFTYIFSVGCCVDPVVFSAEMRHRKARSVWRHWRLRKMVILFEFPESNSVEWGACAYRYEPVELVALHARNYPTKTR
ncbi:Uncharacterized protein HZ326_1871 [Fusarium oxysporum f. sp. albedinis]|nr:Uncharacterized protein HZ326_1871 [Fusarium oxysporum f. sp. albedinis]